VYCIVINFFSLTDKDSNRTTTTKCIALSFLFNCVNHEGLQGHGDVRWTTGTETVQYPSTVLTHTV